MAEELSRIGIAVDSKQAENSLNNIKNQLRSTAKDVKLFDGNVKVTVKEVEHEI